MTIDVSHSIYARVCFQWQVVSIVMQWRGIGSGPGQEGFELVRFYLLMLCSGTQPSARQAGGTIRCTVLFLMGSLPQSRFRFLHQRAHPPPVRQPFSQAQPSANARLARSPKKFPKRSPICCRTHDTFRRPIPQGLTNWKIGLLSFLMLGWSTLNCANYQLSF